jgi:hypothetical protein
MMGAASRDVCLADNFVVDVVRVAVDAWSPIGASQLFVS